MMPTTGAPVIDPLADLKKQIASQKTSGRGIFFQEGRGLLVVRSLFLGVKPQAGPTFIAEHQVLSSVPNGLIDPKTGMATTPNTPGSSVSYVQGLSNPKTKNMAMANVKAYLCTLAGENHQTISEADFSALMEEMLGFWDPQTQAYANASVSYVGALIAYETRRHSTKEHKAQAAASGKAPDFYIFPEFRSVGQTEGNDPEAIAKRAEVLSSGGTVTL